MRSPAIALVCWLVCVACNGQEGDAPGPAELAPPPGLERAFFAGVTRLRGYDDAFSYLLGDIIHRRFQVEELAMQHRRYEALVRTRDSAQLRVFERIVRSEARATDADLAALQSEEDRITSFALHCQELALPEDYPSRLHAGGHAGGYELTHVLLALIWFEENGCQSPVDAAFEGRIGSEVARLLEDAGPVGDLELEAGALLIHWGGAQQVPATLAERVVLAQLADGGFSYAPEGHVANAHATALGTWLLGGLLHPGGYGPSVIQGSR